MLIRIPRLLMKPEAWRFMGFASTVVGLLCYALSTSFNHLIEEWNLLKIFLYSVFSLIICVAVLYAKVWQQSRSLRFQAHMAFLVLTITSVYSFFLDKAVKEKPDAYSLISCVAFALMSFSLSRQTHFGFEVELLYFFLGALIIQLMKIHLWLGVAGAGFSYSLLILHSSLDSSRESEHLRFQEQHHVVVQVDSHSHQANTDIALIMPQLTACLDALKKMNSNIADTLSKLVEKMRYMDYSELETDHNFLIDVLPSGMINDLHETVKLMVSSGFEKECSDVYSSSRKKCLEQCLSKLPSSHKLSFDNAVRTGMQYEIIRRWNEFSKVAFKILIPSERQLCNRVFFGFSAAADLCFTEICQGAMIHLLNFIDDVLIRSHSLQRLFVMLSISKTLRGLIPGLLSFPAAITTHDRLEKVIRDVSMGTAHLIFYFKGAEVVLPNGGLHPMTLNAMDYLCAFWQSRQALEQFLLQYPNLADGVEQSCSLSAQIFWTLDLLELLERKLKAKSRIYKDPALRYVFMMDNWRHIEQTIKELKLETLFGDDWVQKTPQYLELYQKSSWDKVLDFLKLDSNESVPPYVASESMIEKLKLFYLHFRDILNVQSSWSIFDEQLRAEIITSVDNILLPAYENFIERFRNVLGERAYEHIKYGLSDIQARLQHLFLEGK